MNNLMVDIETLGTKPGAPVISLAAVQFDLETGETGEVFHMNINPGSLDEGGNIPDYNTLLWWVEGRSELLTNILKDGIDARIVFTSFCNYITETFKGINTFYVWGNSNRFDLGLLEYQLHLHDWETPWSFRNERDVRTLVHFAPEVKNNLPFEGTKHNPLYDCKHQIKYCSGIFNKLNIK